MTTLLQRGALLAIASLTLVSVSARAAYDPAIVSADARWVIFADLNALRASTLGKEFVNAINQAQSQATGGVIGLDVPKLLATVGMLTAYGTNLSADPKALDGTLIAQGTADLRKIAEGLLLQGTLAQPDVFSEVKDLPFPAYAIVDPKTKDGDKTQLVFAFPPEPIVVISKSKAQLMKARDVFRGAAPSLAKTKSPLAKLTANSEGAYLFAASVVPAEPIFPQNAPQTRILQLVTSGSITFGERAPDTFAHVQLVATSDANADKLAKILQGMASVLSLAESNDKQLSEFLNATHVDRDNETVTLHLAYSSDRLVQMVQTLRNQVEARPVDRRPMITMGNLVEEWGGDNVAAPSGTYTGDPVSHAVDNVKLANGGTITLGRAFNGGKNARFLSLEITPAGGGSPLLYRVESMRNVRGSMWQVQFPGVDGAYTLKVTYVPDPEGRTKFAVSVADARPAGPKAGATEPRSR